MTADTATATFRSPVGAQATCEPRAAAGITPLTIRLAAFAGLACFVLIIVGSFVAPPLWNAPGTSASTARAAAYAQDHSARIIASLVIFSIAMGLFTFFTAGLWAWLRERERPPQVLSTAFAFGAVGLTALILAGFVPLAVLSYRVQSPDIAGTLADLGFGFLALSGISTAVCLYAYWILVLRDRGLPAWTAWLAMAAADAHVLIAASFVSHGSFLSLEGSVIVWVPALFFAWILAASLALLRARPA